MKIIELELNDKITVDEKELYLDDGLKILKPLHQTITKINNYLKKSNKTFDDGEDLLMDTELLLQLDTKNLSNFKKFLLGSTPSLRRRITDFLESFEEASKIIDEQTTLFVPYDYEDLLKLNTYLNECVGNLSCFLYFQYSFDVIYIDKKVDGVLDAVDYYMRHHNVDEEFLMQLASYLHDLLFTSDIDLGVFDKYPELMEPFSKLVGADLLDSVDIDIKWVTDVIDGKKTVNEFQDMLEEKLEGDDGNGKF